MEAYQQIPIASYHEWSEVNSGLSTTPGRGPKAHSKTNFVFWRNRGHKILVFSTTGFHLTPVRMAKIKIKNSGDSRCWPGCGERGTLLHCWWDCKLVQPLWKSVWLFLKKLDIVLLEYPVIPPWENTQKMLQHVRVIFANGVIHRVK
jgi:hypothetical protein